MKNQLSLLGLLLILAFMFPLINAQDSSDEKEEEDEKVDDWVLDLSSSGSFRGVSKSKLPGAASGGAVFGAGGTGGRPIPTRSAPSAMPKPAMVSKKLGLAVGGAKDINTFRENIANKFLPLGSSITVEGLYNDYFFDTGTPEPCETLFCPTYTFANSPDPISGKDEYYMAVGLNSNIEADQFKRKKLNLVVVLDISGSMSSPFTEYHYDKSRQPLPVGLKEKAERDPRSKMEIANEAVQELTKHLRDDDRFGMVVFDNAGHLAKPLNLVGETDMDKIRTHIGKLAPRGGTNFSAGYKKGTELYKELKTADPKEYENRIIFLTDAMPNRGETSEEGLFGITEKNSRQRIYSTFIGIGVDFNTDLIEAITKSKGANYYSVRSGAEFSKLLKDDFEYMVTPMVFDLSLQLKSEGLSIERVYGSPEADLATGELLKVNTLFPSRTEEQAVKGGLILVKLNGDPKGAEITLTASYEKRDGTRESGAQKVTWEGKGFDNSGIRKGVLLARYANLMANWCAEEREIARKNSPDKDEPHYGPQLRCSLHEMPKRGIWPYPIRPPQMKLNKWERKSIPLQVNSESATTLKTFEQYFSKETKALGDDGLKQETKILKKLISLSEQKKAGAKDKIVKEAVETDDGEKKDDWQLQRQ